MSKAIFLDKDGTLIEDVPYNVDPHQMRLLPGVAKGLQAFNAAGYKLIVVSNQSGVARGYFPETALRGVERRLRELLLPEGEAGVALTGFYTCSHHPEAVLSQYRCDCTCRKPAPGLLLQAAAEHGIDLASSWMIGDILDDIEAGRRAGCRTVLIDNGNETVWRLTEMRRPHLRVMDMAEAACLIGGRVDACYLGGPRYPPRYSQPTDARSPSGAPAQARPDGGCLANGE
jgi:D-glycero-D-manno-heptose 1,7-bisphosphate phosphatase